MSYPKAFSYYLSRLSNFSRQKVRLSGIPSTTFGPNSQLVVELPQGLNDLSTFSLHGRVRATGAGVYLPPAELLIDSVSVEIGGVSVQNGFSEYSSLFNIFRNFQFEDKKNFRKMLQLEGRQDGTLVATAIATPDNTATPFCIYNWLGFLSSVKILDTTIMGPVKIYIRFSPSSVLTRSAGTETPSFELSDLRVNLDILDVSDGIYYNMISQRLAQAPLELPFDNYQTVVGSAGTNTQNVRWSTSTDCLEAVIGTVKPANPNTFAPNATTKLSAYFTRPGSDITKSVYRVNGINYPANPCETALAEILVDTAHTLGVSQDVLGGTESAMDTHDKFNAHYFVHAHSFTYPDSEDSHRLCGLSGRTNQLIGDWQIDGGATSVQPLLWLKCKSILRIGAGRMVEVVL